MKYEYLKDTYQGAKIILYEHLLSLHSSGVEVRVSDAGSGDGWLIRVGRTDDEDHGFSEVLSNSRIRDEAYIETPSKHLVTVDRMLVDPIVAALFDQVVHGVWEDIA